jgi:hypothetical protein
MNVTCLNWLWRDPAELPLFRGSITLKALTWESPKNPAQAHKGWSTGLSVLFTNVTSVPQSAVSSVGFLWGSLPGRGLVGFLWGSQKAPTARKMRYELGSVPHYLCSLPIPGN